MTSEEKLATARRILRDCGGDPEAAMVRGLDGFALLCQEQVREVRKKAASEVEALTRRAESLEKNVLRRLVAMREATLEVVRVVATGPGADDLITRAVDATILLRRLEWQDGGHARCPICKAPYSPHTADCELGAFFGSSAPAPPVAATVNRKLRNTAEMTEPDPEVELLVARCRADLQADELEVACGGCGLAVALGRESLRLAPNAVIRCTECFKKSRLGRLVTVEDL